MRPLAHRDVEARRLQRVPDVLRLSGRLRSPPDHLPQHAEASQPRDKMFRIVEQGRDFAGDGTRDKNKTKHEANDHHHNTEYFRCGLLIVLTSGVLLQKYPTAVIPSSLYLRTPSPMGGDSSQGVLKIISQTPLHPSAYRNRCPVIIP